MASLIYTAIALEDVDRLVEFLRQEPQAAGLTAQLLFSGLGILADHPLVGRVTEAPYRELVISRGRTGYIALYEFDAAQDRVIVHGIRHQREAGFDD